MRKDFSRRPGEHIVTWLLRCWDRGTDKAIGKGEPVLSFWRRLLSAMKERYPFKEDVVYRPGKWTTMERGIQYLRELAMQEVIYGDLDDEQLPKDPDEVQCTRPLWRKLVRNAPPSCANSLAILTWKDGEGPTVDEDASQLQEYKENISSSLVSAVEKLSRKIQRLEEDRSYFPPVWTSVSAIRSQRSTAQERGYRRYTPWGILCFYMHDNGEDMRKISLPPLSRLWRNYPGSSNGSKRICPTPHLYGPVSQLLGVSVLLLKREDIEGTHHGAPYGFTCVTTERT
ncbi:hypothetical protein QYF61_004531 [Mycteria americana]|uniref:Uncharacterized protein n=1 Tax=Mycteria americana TaxID=33587 RepID=A0AAN7MJ74_MYCAM|nr:hypothetical protein QYF61_004531 [Mycteria americana]